MLLCLGILLYTTSCETGPSEAENRYQEMLTEHDSLMQIHQQMMTNIQTVENEHQQMTQQLQAAAQPDSTLLAELAQEAVMLAEVKATMAKHQSMQEAHNQFKEKHAAGGLTDAEIDAQVDQMMSDHDMMQDDHDTMTNVIEQIQETHQKVREHLAGNTMDATDGTDDGQ